MTDFEVFAKQVSDSLHGNKEYETAIKFVLSSQTLTPCRIVDDESPVQFFNDNAEELIENDDHTTNADISFANSKVIAVNQHQYAKNNRTPNTSYNNIDASTFINFIDYIWGNSDLEKESISSPSKEIYLIFYQAYHGLDEQFQFRKQLPSDSPESNHDFAWLIS